MILVLEGADFSANNLGKVSVDVDERTKTIMSKYGRQFSTEEAAAIQSFMDGLDDSGILSKLRALYMPVFASSVADSFVNLASADFVQDSLGNTGGVSFSDGGLINDGSMSQFNVTRTTDNDVKRNDIFAAVYGCAGTVITDQMAVLNISNLYTPALISSNLNANNLMFTYQSGPVVLRMTSSDFTNRVYQQGQYGISGVNYTAADLSANKAVFLGRKGYDRCDVTYAKGSETLSYEDLPANEAVGGMCKFINMKSPCKMVVIGKALTDEQLTKFYELVEDVMAVF